jgi:AcrR family transcriptional regulator
MVASQTSRPATQASSDGRRARSKSSRAKIVRAMLDLVGNGEISPSAARVAEAAGVGLRSVFRHFDDMESLYREMSEHIEAQVLPITLRPLAAADWRSQVLELADRRIAVFETILPYRISANIKRFQSAFLMQDYRRMLRLERGSIEAVLPPAVLDDRCYVDALNVPLSFQTWRLLRHDQQLDVGTAQSVVTRLVNAVLAQSDVE